MARLHFSRKGDKRCRRKEMNCVIVIKSGNLSYKEYKFKKILKIGMKNSESNKRGAIIADPKS